MFDKSRQAEQSKKELSEEELALLSTSNEDLEKQNEEFCYDLDEFKERVERGDKWQQVLQTHLYLDHVVTRMLDDALTAPSEKFLDRMGFLQMIELARAMGVLPPELFVPIKYVNKLRNKIAHDLNFQIDNQAILDLERSVPQRLKDAVLEGADRESGPITLFELLNVLLIFTEITRQKAETRRLITKKSEIRLRSVLYKIPNAKYVP